ncbi:MAG: DUF4912 domain-containing protein [bacterium]|jgi:hypothetical protein
MSKKLKAELLSLTKAELLERIRALGFTGYSRFKKEELADLIIAHSKQPKTAKPAAKKADKESARAQESRSLKPRGSKEPANGIAIQHPSASPSARRYGSRGAPEAATDAATPEKPADYGKEEITPPAIWPDRDALPERYGVDVLVALPRDPEHMFCFWEISGDTLGALASEFGDSKWNSRRMVLKLLPKERDGREGSPAQTLDVYGETGRWHIALPESARGKRIGLEIGFFFTDGSYRKVLSSEPVEIPRGAPDEGGKVRFMLVKPARAKSRARIESLETRTFHRHDSIKALRREVEKSVAKRRRELGISPAPQGASELGRFSQGESENS